VNQLLDEVDEKESAAEKEFSHRKATKHVAGMKQAISDLLIRKIESVVVKSCCSTLV